MTIKIASLIHLAKNILGGTPVGRGGRQPPCYLYGPRYGSPTSWMCGHPKTKLVAA